jgi:succinate-acetate transporter protein
MLRPIATPFPVGLGALATASLLASGLELGWFSSRDTLTVAVALIAFCFPLQFLAAIFGFLGRDTAAATSFGIQAGTWLVIGLSLLLSPAARPSPPLGVLELTAAVWVALAAGGAANNKLVPAIVLFAVALRFLLSGLYELGAGNGVEDAGAVVGLGVALAAAYAALALELENARRHTTLPLLRRNRGAEAMQADLAVQNADVAHEAGVREQL